MQAVGKRSIWIGLVVILVMGLWAIPASAQTPCDTAGGSLSDIQARRQLKQFVHCAIDHVEKVGWEQAVTDFRTDPAWLDRSIYLFGLDENAISLFNEGQGWPPGTDVSHLQDEDGVKSSLEMIRLSRTYGAGFVYYRFRNPETGEDNLKVAYVKSLEVDGLVRILGSGLYPLDAPGACSPQYVRASLVYTEDDLERFVNCAEHHLRKHGIKALLDFNSGPRWAAGSTYLFLLDKETLTMLSHGSDANLIGQDLTELTDPDGVMITQEMRRIVTYFDEGYVYYGFNNPATNQTEPKASFVKQVYLDGRSYILGAGLYISSPECRTLPLARDISTKTELELYVNCAHQLVLEQGEFAFDLFAQHQQWIGGASYIYVLNEQCRSIVYPLDYKEDEIHSCDLKDARGNLVNQMIMDTASRAEGQGWVEYYWLNPDSNEVETKTAFVMAVTINDAFHVIGAGLYGLAE